MSQLLTSLGTGAGALGAGVGKGVQAIGQGVGGGLSGLVHGLFSGGGPQAVPVPGAPAAAAANAAAQAAADAGGAGPAADSGGPNFFPQITANPAGVLNSDPSQRRQMMANLGAAMGGDPRYGAFAGQQQPGATPGLRRPPGMTRRGQLSAPPFMGASGIELDPRISSDPELMQRDPKTGMPLYLLRGMNRMGPQV